MNQATSTEKLLAQGYTITHVPADWHDDGDAENGPHLSGCCAHDVYQLGDRYAIVVDGEVVEEGVDPPCQF